MNNADSLIARQGRAGVPIGVHPRSSAASIFLPASLCPLCLCGESFLRLAPPKEWCHLFAVADAPRVTDA
jgi:hypothetical protein